jgi:hypothetical protein
MSAESVIQKLDEACKYVEQDIYRSVMSEAASEIERLKAYILDLESSVRYLTLQSTKGL